MNRTYTLNITLLDIHPKDTLIFGDRDIFKDIFIALFLIVRKLETLNLMDQ